MAGIGQFLSPELQLQLIAAQSQNAGNQAGSQAARGLLQLAQSAAGPTAGLPILQGAGGQGSGAPALNFSDLTLLHQLQAAGLAGGPNGLFSQFGSGNGGANAGGAQDPTSAALQGLTGATVQGTAGLSKLPIGIEELAKLGRGGMAGGHQGGGGAGGGKPTRSSDSRSSSAYASRHQAAEQRRRTRINERLELLRKMVPHAERANTACFLEEVIKYIDSLKRRTVELEAALGIKTGKTASGLTEPEAPMALSNTSVSLTPSLQQFAALQQSVQQQQQQQAVAAVAAAQQQQAQQQQAANLMAGLAAQQQVQNGLAAQAAANGAGAGAVSGAPLPGQGQQQSSGQAMAGLTLPPELQNVQGLQGLSQGLSQGLFQQNNKFLQFNEDLFVVKPEVARLASMGAAAAAAAAGTNGAGLQLPAGLSPELLLAASSQQPAAALTNPEARKALSGSPVSSEESGVPIKKRKVLLL